MDEDIVKSIIPDAEDIDSPTLNYIIVGTPSHGSVEVFGNYFAYTPSSNYNGTDSFIYAASDDEFISNFGNVSITITAVNDLSIIHI